MDMAAPTENDIESIKDIVELEKMVREKLQKRNLLNIPSLG